MSTVDPVTTVVNNTGQVLARPWETSDPFFSAYTRDLFETVFKCYIRNIITYIGIFGNVMCCVVFWKQGLSDRINLLLFWLAVIDFCNLALQVPSTISCYTSDKILLNNINVISHTKMSRLFICCGMISGFLIVVMSIERCLCVVIPFKARRLLTYRSMVAALILSYLIPFLAYLPLILGDTVKWRLDPSTNRSLAYMVPTSWFPAGELKTVTSTYLNLVGQPLMFVIVVVCSIITIRHLHQTSIKRAEMTGKMSEERKRSAVDNRLTVMLLLICFVYAVSSLCQICGSILYWNFPEFYPYKKYHNSFIVFYHSFVLMASCVNSTVNFCAYLVLSSRFRVTLRELCPCFSVLLINKKEEGG